MKKSKLFLSTGAFVLAISAMFASKANKKFTEITTAYIGATGAYVKGFADNVLTVTQGSNKTAWATIYTTAGSLLVTKLHTSTGGKTLFHLHS